MWERRRDSESEGMDIREGLTGVDECREELGKVENEKCNYREDID